MIHAHFTVQSIYSLQFTSFENFQYYLTEQRRLGKHQTRDQILNRGTSKSNLITVTRNSEQTPRRHANVA